MHYRCGWADLRILFKEDHIRTERDHLIDQNTNAQCNGLRFYSPDRQTSDRNNIKENVVNSGLGFPIMKSVPWPTDIQSVCPTNTPSIHAAYSRNLSLVNIQIDKAI